MAEYAALLDRRGRLFRLRLLRSSGTDILDNAGVAATERSETLLEAVKVTAWKAQVRLCARYGRLQRAGKPTDVMTVAIARELAAFVRANATIAMPPLEQAA